MEIINNLLNSIQHKDKTHLKNSFKLPIELIDKKYNLNNNIIEDLELKKIKNEEHEKDKDSVSDYNNDVSNNYNNLVDNENLYYNLLNNVDFNNVVLPAAFGPVITKLSFKKKLFLIIFSESVFIKLQ